MLELDHIYKQQAAKGTSSPHARLVKYALGFSAILGWALSLVLLTSSSNNVLHTDYLSAVLAYNHVRYTVWFHSEGEIRELRSILSQHDINDKKEAEKVKIIVEAMLVRRTDVYAQELNKLNTSIDYVGNHYLTLFRFESFLQDVIEICLAKDRELDSKMIDIFEVMFVYQTEANTLIREDLLDAENNKGLLL
ncbi:hypothetical protein [Vibrio sonorensis]|uniref:hypothetical protein n=1 Tax=Vibrio sonorensis TaxID=1004316 RepID=UPI0008D90FB1|nr:hypothetical protein [Vibrio sonorensis]